MDVDVYYSKDLTKKKKIFAEGFLRVEESMASARLVGEDGDVLCSVPMNGCIPSQGSTLTTEKWLIEIIGVRSTGSHSAPPPPPAPPPKRPRPLISRKPFVNRVSAPNLTPFQSGTARTDEDCIALLLGSDEAIPTPPIETPVVGQVQEDWGWESAAVSTDDTLMKRPPPPVVDKRPFKRQLLGGKSFVPSERSAQVSFPNESYTRLFFDEGCKRQPVLLPDRFSSVAEYRSVLTKCLQEQINLILIESALKFYPLAPTEAPSDRRPGHGRFGYNVMAKKGENVNCDCDQPARKCTVSKAGKNKGREFWGCAKRKCKFFQWVEDAAIKKNVPTAITTQARSNLASSNLDFYESCELTVSSTKVFLKLSRRQHGKGQYSLSDLWVVSPGAIFQDSASFVAHSVYREPSSTGVIELVPFSHQEMMRVIERSNTNVTVVALRVGNAASQCVEMSNLEALPDTLPILPHLLSGKPSFHGLSQTLIQNIPHEQVMQMASAVIDEFSLNPDQAQALNLFASMLTGHSPQRILLVHGVFGSGKSHLVVVLIIFFNRVTRMDEGMDEDDHGDDSDPPKSRLMMAAATNVAVDRVLLGLLDQEFESFARVGCLRKMAKRVLPHTLRSTQSTKDGDADDERDLKMMLSESLNASERASVGQALREVRDKRKRRMLANVRVVGSTCRATQFKSLCDMSEKSSFPVVVLDECSQMIEPASLLPIARYGCQILLLFGDPMQLPPTIMTPSFGTTDPLDKTLFSRLMACGVNPVMLKTQYRLHPILSAIPNALFYDGQLVDGVAESDRQGLIQGLPPLVVVDLPTHAGEMVLKNGGVVNDYESKVVVQLIDAFQSKGIAPESMGVICLYKEQAHLVSQKLAERSQITVATVDAFQGSERELIILATSRVRAATGFVEQNTRLNVALTRAKRHLVVVERVEIMSKASDALRMVVNGAKGVGGLHSATDVMVDVGVLTD